MDSVDNKSISCLMCKENKKPVDGMQLKCTHIFCWVCLDSYLQKNLNAQVKCPKDSCRKNLTDKEIRQMLSDDDIGIYEKKVMGLSSDIKKCLLPNCEGIVVCGDCSTQYTCSLCNLYNCVACKAPHADYKCNGFQSLPPQDKMEYSKVQMKEAEKVYEQTKTEYILDKEKLNKHPKVGDYRIFICFVCKSSVDRRGGVMLQNCHCEICKLCLSQTILTSTSILVLCPICYEEHIDADEIKSVLSRDQLLTYQNKCSKIAKSTLDSSFRSQAPVWLCIVCKTSLQKLPGSNWIQCPGCKTELCWITQMTRWGPKGRGDTSEGCKCGVNGMLCHPKCEKNCQPLN